MPATTEEFMFEAPTRAAKKSITSALRRASVLLCLLSVGCGNVPSLMENTPPRVDVIEKFGASANYRVIDKFSFTRAEVKYPASPGFHRIGIGEFLVGELLTALGDRQVDGAQLKQFDVGCENSSMILPHAICRGSYRIDVFFNGRMHTLSGRVGDLDIGNVRVRDAFLTPTQADDSFHKQIAPLLDALSRSLQTNIAAELR